MSARRAPPRSKHAAAKRAGAGSRPSAAPKPDAARPGRGNNVAAPTDADLGLSAADFDQLVADVLENPERILDADLTPEQILELQKRLNPYAGVAGAPPDPKTKRVAACSFTNLREDYICRLSMTSLVGFVFQMLHEWEVPADARRWTPAAPAGAAPFEAARLAGQLEAALAVAQEASRAAEAAAEAKRAAAEAGVCLGDDAPAAARAEADARLREAEAAAERAAGLLYAATHTANSIGLDAGQRLRATAEAGMQYPGVRSILGQQPLPAAPGTVEMPAAAAKDIISGFLKHWFEFDPSVHVRSGHDAKAVAGALERVSVGRGEALVDTEDPRHLTLEAVRAAAPEPAPEHRAAVETILASREAYSAAIALLRDGDLAEAAAVATAAPEAFRQYLLPVPPGSPARPAADVIPPQDTFHRWRYFTEVNYEELRTITEALYPERPDLDWALALWEVFEGPPAEVDADFDKFCQRYQDDVPSSIRSLEFGGWSLLADFKKNRDKIQFYNKKTEVIKRILDRHAKDKEIGAELMRQRVRAEKAKNIAAEGPDAPGLAKYKRALGERGGDLRSTGAERVITPEEMRRLERARGDLKAAKELELLEQHEATIERLSELEKLRPLTDEEGRDLAHARANVEKAREMVAVPDDAIQIDVFKTDGATGEFSRSHIYTKAFAPDHLENVSGGAVPGALPPFAPYALEHIAAEAAQRSTADMHAEAVRDHGR